MACLRPIGGRKGHDGIKLYRDLAGSKIAGAGQYLEIPCRSCEACRAQHTQHWAIRGYHESLLHTRNHNGQEVPNVCFITLTYNDAHLPAHGSLSLRDWQLFRKKLNNHVGSVRYLHCGEYGSSGTKRPHDHAILFGCDFSDDRYRWRYDAEKKRWHYRSPTLEKLWSSEYGPKGHAEVTDFNFGSAAYVAGYVFKKLRHNSHLDDRAIFSLVDHKFQDRHKIYEWQTWENSHLITPEYITMSKKPGLGAKWIEKNLYRVYPRDVVLVDGREFRPPPFYDHQLKLLDPALHATVMAKRQEHAANLKPTSPLELRARGENFAARFKNANHKTRSKVQ